jgi:hypothetical protein
MKYTTHNCQPGFYVIQEGRDKGDLVYIWPGGIQAFSPETGKRSWAIKGRNLQGITNEYKVSPVALSRKPRLVQKGKT